LLGATTTTQEGEADRRDDGEGAHPAEGIDAKRV
jgi:hypothetical protein